MNAQVPPLVRPSDKDFADSSSKELHVQPHYVETTRSRFLDVTDGDLLKYCTGMGGVCQCLISYSRTGWESTSEETQDAGFSI